MHDLHKSLEFLNTEICFLLEQYRKKYLWYCGLLYQPSNWFKNGLI